MSRTKLRIRRSILPTGRRVSRMSSIEKGDVSYLSKVIDADRSVLQQQLVAVSLDGERARSVVNLIRAIGGGWGGDAAAQTTAAKPADSD